MTKQEFDSLRVGSKVTNKNSSWNGVVTETYCNPKTIKVHWKRVFNGEVFDDDYNFRSIENWIRFVSNPEDLVGLEEFI